jgi:DNA-binding LacI/PurR family transcriptional regulator
MASIAKLQDVAKKANVSITAASLILNKKSNRFSKKTTDKVFNTAKELGWYRNLLSRGIQSGKTQTVGVLVGPDDSYYSDLLAGIHKELSDADYVPITLWADSVDDDLDRFESGRRQVTRLIERRVDGLILRSAVALTYEAHFQELISKNIPVVVIDHELKGEVKADTVESDEEQGAKFVVTHLVGLGHKRICYLGDINYEKLEWGIRRKRFFEFEAGLVPNVSYEWCCVDFTKHNEEDSIKEMLQSDLKPTAFFCESDKLAKLVYQVASTLGVNIPEDLSVVGFADLSFAKEMSPPLTSVRQKGVELGRHAARIIIERAEGKLEGVSPHCIRLACELVVRDSTSRAKE